MISDERRKELEKIVRLLSDTLAEHTRLTKEDPESPKLKELQKDLANLRMLVAMELRREE